jgi:hypothetical protein
MWGRRRSWTVPVYLLRSDQWNAHIHAVPADAEEEPPADGNPHPFHGPHTTAEQRFQQRLQLWLQQNGMGGGIGGAGGAGHHANHDSEATLSITATPDFTFPRAGQVNYQSILRDQGVLFSDGVQPMHNVRDSPMSAWHDMMSDSSASSDSTLQIITGDSDFAESSAQGAARGMARASPVLREEDEIPSTFMIARFVLLNFQQPNIHISAKSLSSAVFPPMNLIRTFFSAKDDMEETENCMQNRRVARKLNFEDSPSSMPMITDVNPREDLGISNAVMNAKKAKGGRKKEVLVNTAVRRSPRNNIYNGFKTDMPSDARKRKTKVKSRVVPEVLVTPVKNVSDNNANKDSVPPVPPPTPVPILQKIGTKICAIPPEELTEAKLMGSEAESEDEV